MRLKTRPLIAGLVIGGIAAAAILVLPHTALESIVGRLKLDQLLDAAKPPLGLKVRFILGLFPFFFLTALGLVIGIVLGGRKKDDEEFGVYPDYNLGAPPTEDPFSTADQSFAQLPADDAFADPLPPPPPEPTYQPAPAYAAPPPPAIVEAAPVDVVTAADVAEMAEAIVRLDARVDALEAKIAAAPHGAVPADLAERLAKIARALDDAG